LLSLRIRRFGVRIPTGALRKHNGHKPCESHLDRFDPRTDSDAVGVSQIQEGMHNDFIVPLLQEC